MSVEPQVAKRVVPGAPPPAPLTKAQKKKRRTVKKDEGNDEPVSIANSHDAALVDKAPSESDIKSGEVADVLVAHEEAPTNTAVADEAEVEGPKTSPIVEMLGKRLKTLGKKIARIHTYSSRPLSELNDDQKKTLATLPSLEAAHKELEEIKKSVEAIELDEVRAEARRRAEAERAEKIRITQALEEAQRAHVVRAAQLLDFLNLHFSLANSDPSIQALNLAEQELAAIDSAGQVLLHRGHESKHDVLTGFFVGDGDIVGVPYLRLLEMTEAHMNPVEPELAPTETEEVIDVEVTNVEVVLDQLEEEPLEEPEVAVTAIPPVGTMPSGLTGSTSFTFMQESELENDPVSFESGAEWVDKEEIAEVTETVTVIGDSNGDVEAVIEVTETVIKPSNGASWADDEGDLPPIEDIHAHFGTSGSATPAADPVVDAVPQQPANAWGALPSAPAAAPEAPATNGAGESYVDEEGFVHSRGGRGRARGGFRGRGGERGGYRGGRGGGERGGFRGGHRGEFRGGDRGGRGRPDNHGQWRGGSDGEFRGRGRGRGRGGDRGGDRGGYRGGRPDGEAPQ